MPKETLIHIREHQAEFPGVQGVMLTKRAYPNGDPRRPRPRLRGRDQRRRADPRRSKGYRPGDSIGKSGVELAYEDDLRGQPEVEKLEVDAQGRVLRSLGKQPAVQGHDVRLTIDLDLQRVAEESLQLSLDRGPGHLRQRVGQALPRPRRLRGGARPPRRQRAGHGLLPHLRPGRLRRRDQREGLRRPPGPGRPLPPQQPGHPGPLRPRRRRSSWSRRSPAWRRASSPPSTR